MYLAAIEKVIDDFNIYLYRHNGRFVGCCPLHADADNPTAFNINHKTGYFFCNTAHCHELVKNNDFESFVWCLLSSRLDPEKYEEGVLCDKSLVASYLEKNAIDITRLNIDRCSTYKTPKSVELNLPLSYFDNYDIGNCAFFINRGFSREILKKHYVFTCPDPKKKFYNLCIVPIFDINKTKCIGITARMPYSQCLACEGYHNPQELCSDIIHNSFNPKWRHEPKGFLKGNYLYNIWNSWRYIKHWRDIIIVESPGNVFKLEQCGFNNSVALLGSTISEKQRKLIDRLDPSRIYVIGDNDRAGYSLMKSVGEIYPQAKPIKLDTENDIADMTDDKLKDLIWSNIDE